MTQQETPRVAPRDVTEFLKVTDAALETYQAAMAEVDEKFPKRNHYDSEGRRQREIWHRERRAPIDTYNAAQDAAWNALKASSDPLVKWIADNCTDYYEAARVVLQALPATVDELDDLAVEQDWCGTWDEFRGRAVEAGVLPGVKPLTEARKALFEQIDDESCCRLDSGAKRRVSRALDAVIQEAIEAAKEPEAVSA